MKELIKKLVETVAPSGYEGPIRQVVREAVEGLTDEVRVDKLGNLIVRRGPMGGAGDNPAQKIMLVAHVDEIGVMATHVDEKGFVRFIPIGGVRPQTCPGGRVRFLNGAQGVIGSERIDDPAKTPGFEQMFIDLGASSPADCPVRVGDIAAFERPFLDLGDRLVAKSMDDRIGVAVLIEALRGLQQTPNEVYFVFSVQEEVGIRGATVAAFGLEPDLGIAVDVTAWGDTPKGMRMEVALGKGPAIKVRDSGMLADPRVVAWMVRTAEEAGLPYQLEVLERGSTDAAAIQLSRAGTPAGTISIPCRYVHSPSEMVDYNDVQNAVRLLVALLSKPVELS
ncbi:MAG: M42 family metallopeptidase [Anaerolineales bacterium]|nr:M42 family metallopeptidase [Anaerolineales bacterium]